MSPSDAILVRLAAIDKLIESHRAAVFVLENERAELQGRLRLSGWTPPTQTAEGRTA